MTKEKKVKEKVSKKDGKKTSFLDKINTNKVKNIVTNKYLVSSGALTLNIFIIEMYLRFLTDGSFNDFGVVRIFISSLIIGMSISWILHFFKRIIVRIINAILIGVIGIYAFVELLLYNLIGFYMGIGNADQGTKVGEFVESTLKTMNLLHASLLIVTIILVLVYIFSDIHISKKANKPKKRKFGKALLINMIPLLVIGLLCAFYYHTVRDKKYQSELQADSNYSLWLYPENSNLTVNNYGVVVYIFLDIKNQITGITSEDILLLENKELEEKPQEEEPVTDYTRIIDDTAWKTLIDNTTNSTYNAVNNYLINRSITPKNEYTGLFKGKNLIIILMESVNEIAIYNKDYFPTLYKMYNEGISFKNNYSPRNNCSTGNNEMTVLTSLWTINNTCTANSYNKNKYFQASFNVFNREGYKTAAFHDYTQKFYFRGTSLPNMGASAYYGVEKLGIPYSTSYTEADDKDMFKAAKQYYMNDAPFMVYFASVTPHQSYTASQTCSDRYFAKYKELGYSDYLSRYLSKMQVFDEAMKELLDELEETGELDNTVIAMFGDHFPYGLTDNDINDFFNKNNAGYTINRNSTTNKNVDKTPMLIYNSTLESPIQVTDYTTIIDLLPTLLNLFDMNYDPRLYLGTDALSETHVSRAYFSDKSWVDENGFYYAPNNKMTYTSDKKYDAATIASINKEISQRQNMSATAIQNNYFKYLGEGLEKYKVVEEPKQEETE
ncbi:MAG: sulfatase-like hydrolase/transferase [Bacilli bacterium]|nr:sulfatase-like hydrolase/transferase [Bacilli bacterium]